MEADEEGQVERRCEACQPASPPRGHQYSVLNGAGEVQAGDHEWQSRALDHWRALEFLSQMLAEGRQDKIRRPRRATSCGSERGEPSREGCLLFAAAERC